VAATAAAAAAAVAAAAVAAAATASGVAGAAAASGVAGAAAASGVAGAAAAAASFVPVENDASRSIGRRATHRHNQNDTVHVTSRVREQFTPHNRSRTAGKAKTMVATDSLSATITTLPIFPDWLGCESGTD
jgi:hypothetical protein